MPAWKKVLLFHKIVIPILWAHYGAKQWLAIPNKGQCWKQPSSESYLLFRATYIYVVIFNARKVSLLKLSCLNFFKVAIRMRYFYSIYFYVHVYANY